MAKVYLSSTFRDLQRHRLAAYRALRRLGHDVIGMEDYVAGDERPLKKCLDDVGSVDIYIGILAWRYGFTPPNQDLSITELEMRQAELLGKPRLMFLLDERARWPRERWDADITSIRALRDRVKLERTISYFKSAAELAELVATAVTKELEHTSAGSVLLDVGVAPNKEAGGPAELVARYRRSGESEVLLIEPSFDFLDKIARGSPVDGLGYRAATVFPAVYPEVTIRVVNNSSGTILFSRLAALVEQSSPHEQPFCVPANYSRPGRHVLILNEGSGEVSRCTLWYRAVSYGERYYRGFDDLLPFSVRTEGFTRSWFADLSNGLAEQGVNIDALQDLRSLRTSIGGPNSDMPGVHYLTRRGWMSQEIHNRRVLEACGPFGMEAARLLGRFEQETGPGVGTIIRFETEIDLFSRCGYHPILESPAAPDLLLDVDRKGYEASMPLEQAVKVGEVVELKVRVGAPRPSRHRLQFQLIYNQGHHAKSRPFSLSVFVPRSSYEGEPWKWMYRSSDHPGRSES